MKPRLFYLLTVLCLTANCSYGQGKTYYLKRCEIVQGITKTNNGKQVNNTCLDGHKVIVDEASGKITLASNDKVERDMVYAITSITNEPSTHKTYYKCLLELPNGIECFVLVTKNSFNNMFVFKALMKDNTFTQFNFQYQ